MNTYELNAKAREIALDGDPCGEYEEIRNDLMDDGYTDAEASYIIDQVADYFDRVGGHY